jgi:hypothetical protein
MKDIPQSKMYLKNLGLIQAKDGQIILLRLTSVYTWNVDLILHNLHPHQVLITTSAPFE